MRQLLHFEDKQPTGKREILPKKSDENVMPFWRWKTLSQLTRTEWESLCDGCGRCCLVKLEDEDTGDIYLTKLSCQLLNTKTCRCKDYDHRHKRMPDCVAITPSVVRKLKWLPKSCAYRRVAEGRDLAWWHPLVSGRPETVVEAGISVKGWATSEARIKSENIERYIIDDFDNPGDED